MHLQTERDPDGGWYDRYVRIVDDEGHVIEDFGEHPLSTNCVKRSGNTASGSISGSRVSSATSVGTRSTIGSPLVPTGTSFAGTVRRPKKETNRVGYERTSIPRKPS